MLRRHITADYTFLARLTNHLCSISNIWGLRWNERMFLMITNEEEAETSKNNQDLHQATIKPRWYLCAYAYTQAHILYRYSQRPLSLRKTKLIFHFAELQQTSSNFNTMWKVVAIFVFFGKNDFLSWLQRIYRKLHKNFIDQGNSKENFPFPLSPAPLSKETRDLSAAVAFLPKEPAIDWRGCRWSSLQYDSQQNSMKEE